MIMKLLLRFLLHHLRSAAPEQVFSFRCEGCGAVSLNPIYVQNHRAFACDRYLAYREEEKALREEYRKRAAGRLTLEVLLEYESRLRALQSTYVSGWDRNLKRATYRGPAVPLTSDNV